MVNGWLKNAVRAGIGVCLVLPACEQTTPSSPSVPSVPVQKVCQVICWSCSENSWGALAYSPSTGKCGASFGFRTQTEAETSAIGFCANSDCIVVGGQSGHSGYSNQCGALAAPVPFSSKNNYATSGRQTAAEAQSAAVAGCQQ